MGDGYAGEERRNPHLQYYNAVCDKRMTAIDSDLKNFIEKDFKPLKEDVAEIKEKINNGLGHLPRKMNWMIALSLTFIIALIPLAWGILQSHARLEALVEMEYSK